jgi:hypothetical protein
VITESHAALLAQSLKSLLSAPRAGTVAYLRCLPSEIIACRRRFQNKQLPIWDYICAIILSKREQGGLARSYKSPAGFPALSPSAGAAHFARRPGMAPTPMAATHISGRPLMVVRCSDRMDDDEGRGRLHSPWRSVPNGQMELRLFAFVVAVRDFDAAAKYFDEALGSLCHPGS